jgi:hypothetical protein
MRVLLMRGLVAAVLGRLRFGKSAMRKYQRSPGTGGGPAIPGTGLMDCKPRQGSRAYPCGPRLAEGSECFLHPALPVRRCPARGPGWWFPGANDDH